MTETYSIQVDMPEFMDLVDAEARVLLLKEINEKIKDQVSELFENTAREIIARKLNLIPSDSMGKPAELAEPSEKAESKVIQKDVEVLAEEILSLPEGEAMAKLKLSLASGKIDEETYQELKALVRPAFTCPQCHKTLDPAALYCRFCGAKIR